MLFDFITNIILFLFDYSENSSDKRYYDSVIEEEFKELA